MKGWSYGLAAILLVYGVGVIGFLVFMIREGGSFDRDQAPHESLPLEFHPPFQPDKVGPIRVRFSCPERPRPVQVTVKVLYAGHPGPAGRPYANETFEILLAPVHATGLQGEIIDVPAKAMDRRTRGLVDRSFGADVTVTGPDGLFGTHYVLPGNDTSGVIEVRCSRS
ncbi:MAG: hypothetical protein ACK4UQ_07395 [Brevundimonas sp.]